MSFDAQKLYELLPAIYRVRDAEQGEPLRALLAVIAEQIGVLEEDLEQTSVAQNLIRYAIRAHLANQHCQMVDVRPAA